MVKLIEEVNISVDKKSTDRQTGFNDFWRRFWVIFFPKFLFCG